jgi:predicted DNA-binding transcriptional regulator AlpA
MSREKSMLTRRLRFEDLVDKGIVNNRTTLIDWIKRRDFPPGQMTGPNTRTWGEPEVEAWLASRPTEPKPWPQPRGRPLSPPAGPPRTAKPPTPPKKRGRPRKYPPKDVAVVEA